MLQLFNTYTIIHQFRQLNLSEYGFVAVDAENKFTFIYITERAAIVQCTEFQAMNLKPLCDYNLSNYKGLVEQIVAKLKNVVSNQQKSSFCNLSLESIFMDEATKQILIPSFIILQLQESLNKDMFIYDFEQKLLKHQQNAAFIEKECLFRENYLCMKKIKARELDCNDQVPKAIHNLFDSFINITIDDISIITTLKNNEILSEAQIYDNNNSYQQMKDQYENYVKGRLLIPISDVNLIVNFTRDFLNPPGNDITEYCREIQDYHQRNQSGMRVTATQLFNIHKMESVQKSNNSCPATEYGNTYEAIALQQYQCDHQEFVLKKTDVLYSLKYPFICGTPDSIVYNLKGTAVGVVEVKCPFNNQQTDLQSNFADVAYILVDSQENYFLKRNHSYYYQIQAYLLITDLDWCDLVIYTHKGVRVLRQFQDQECIKEIINDSTNYFFKQIASKRCGIKKQSLDDQDVQLIMVVLME